MIVPIVIISGWIFAMIAVFALIPLSIHLAGPGAAGLALLAASSCGVLIAYFWILSLII